MINSGSFSIGSRLETQILRIPYNGRISYLMTKALAMKHCGMVGFALFIVWNTLAAARTLYLSPVTYGSVPTAPSRSASIARPPRPETALRALRIAHRSHAGDCSRLVCVAAVGALLGCAAGAVRDPPAAAAKPESGLRIATCALAGCRGRLGMGRYFTRHIVLFDVMILTGLDDFAET